jgi:hypothetical protein
MFCYEWYHLELQLMKCTCILSAFTYRTVAIYQLFCLSYQQRHVKRTNVVIWSLVYGMVATNNQ